MAGETTHLNVKDTSTKDSLARKATLLNKSLSWLSPTHKLESKGGREFGRGIVQAVNGLNKTLGVLRLKVRCKDAAVVMSVGYYEELVRMKALYEQLIEKVKENEITEEADQFDRLYDRITSAESRKSADALFTATPSELRKTYQPGTTETQ